MLFLCFNYWFSENFPLFENVCNVCICTCYFVFIKIVQTQRKNGSVGGYIEKALGENINNKQKINTKTI